MTNQFKVELYKTAEILQDFILFSYRANNPGGTTRMITLSLGLLVIAKLAIKEQPKVALVTGALGIISLVFSLFKHKLAANKLKKADEAYKNHTKCTYVFSKSGITIYMDDELDTNVGGYDHISCFYSDEKNYYVGINNEDLLLIPKTSFVEGEASDFPAFIENKSQEPCVFLPATFKNKWAQMKMKRMQEAE